MCIDSKHTCCFITRTLLLQQIRSHTSKRWLGSWRCSPILDLWWWKRWRCVCWRRCHFSQTPRSVHPLVLILLNCVFIGYDEFMQQVWLLNSSKLSKKLVLNHNLLFNWLNLGFLVRDVCRSYDHPYVLTSIEWNVFVDLVNWEPVKLKPSLQNGCFYNRRFYLKEPSFIFIFLYGKNQEN